MSVRIVNTSKKSKKSKTRQFTSKGLSISDMVDTAKAGDRLVLVADYTFGLTHDTTKTLTLEDPEYTYKSGSREYTKGSSRITIINSEGRLFSMFGNDDYIVGLDIKK